MLNLNNLKPAEGSRSDRKRVGRGNSSGLGGTAGRGHKGQMSRSGSSTRPGFEGGQTPLYRRIPKNRGFNNISVREYATINIQDLSKFTDGEVVTLEYLKQKKMVNNRYKMLKILGKGDVTSKITIVADKITTAAADKLEKASVKVQLL